MHHGLLAKNGEYVFLDRRFFDDLPVDELCPLAECDLGAMILDAESALSRLAEYGALSQWLLQRLNHLSGNQFRLDLDDDLAGWFTLDLIVLRSRKLIGRFELDGSDLHIDCTLHGDDLRECNDALNKLIRVCVREFHLVQELQEEPQLVEEEW